MKFIHLSDLHIGKRVNGFSMMEDQEYILNEIINIIDNEEPQAVILAGDIYDKAIPQADAVELLDDFLVKLSERRLQVFVISGDVYKRQFIWYNKCMLISIRTKISICCVMQTCS